MSSKEIEKKKEKLNKKLTSFLKEKGAFSKRFKSLTSYTDLALNEPQEGSFYQDHAETVFSVIHEKWNELLNEAAKEKDPKKRDKKTLPEQTSVLTVLKRMVPFLKSQIQKKWKIDQLNSIVQQALSTSNRPQIRLLGFSVLLSFIEGLNSGNEPVDDQIGMFASAINFKPFLEGKNGNAKLKNTAKVDQNDVVANEATKQDGVDLLRELFDFGCSNPESFAFWWVIFKEFYAPTFYPTIFKKMGVLTDDDNSGFINFCPHEFQALIIEKLDKFSTNQKFIPILWEDDPECSFMMEIFRQSMMLPMNYLETINKSIDLYQRWILKDPERIQGYQKLYYPLLLGSFLTTSTADLTNTHTTHLRKTFQGFYSLIEGGQTREMELFFLNLLLDICVQFLLTLDQAPPQEKGTSILATEFFSELFLLWLKSPVTTSEEWANFQKRITQVTHWKPVISVWKEKVIQVTLLLKTKLFPTPHTILSRKPTTPIIRVEPTQIKLDSKMENFQLEDDRLTELWFILLDVLGNLQTITVPQNYELAISCFQETVGVLLLTEKETLKYDEHPSLPVIGIFSPVLFEATTHPNLSQMVKGVQLAYTILGTLFCRQTTYPIDMKTISHYYRALISALRSENDTLISTVLSVNANIFSLDLPGVNILIPDFLREIDKVINGGMIKNFAPEVEAKCFTIVHSLLGYSYHFLSCDIPTINETTSGTSMSFKDIHSQLFGILVGGCARQNAFTKQQALNGITVGLTLEFLSPNPTMDTTNLLTEILNACKSETEYVTCMECLATLAQLENKIPISVSYHVVTTLSELVIGMISSKPVGATKAKISSAILYNIAEWCTVIRHDLILDDQTVYKKVTEAVEWALFGELIDPQRFDRDIKWQSNPKPNFSSYYQYMLTQPAHASPELRTAGLILLNSLLKSYAFFPSIGGPELTSSDLTFGNDVQMVTFLVHDVTLISFAELTDEQGQAFARVIIRDLSGKYVWDFYEVLQHWKPRENPPLKPSWKIEPVSEPKVGAKSNYQRRKDELPLWNEGNDHNVGVDMTYELLNYLTENFPEILPNSKQVQRFDSPYLPSSGMREDIESTVNTLKGIEQQEIAAVRNQSSRKPLRLQPTEIPEISSFRIPRQLLSHMGFLTLENQKRMILMDDNAKLRRAIRDLDKIQSREVLKIGVIYVAEGQEDQRTILKNSKGSQDYTDFLRGLGWDIDLKNHKGFFGGLDTYCGNSTPYYANSQYEVIFHSATRIPTDEVDPQQIQKKRHIGNDIVHVIWSEHKRDYPPSTITSQFNDAHIMIYPLSNGLYRVQVSKKDKVEYFGPLQNEMTVTKEVLPFLVRQTAINANRRVRYATQGYKRPYVARQEYIREHIVDRYKSHRTFQDFIFNLFPLKSNTDWKEEMAELKEVTSLSPRTDSPDSTPSPQPTTPKTPPRVEEPKKEELKKKDLKIPKKEELKIPIVRATSNTKINDLYAKRFSATSSTDQSPRSSPVPTRPQPQTPTSPTVPENKPPMKPTPTPPIKPTTTTTPLMKPTIKPSTPPITPSSKPTTPNTPITPVTSTPTNTPTPTPTPTNTPTSTPSNTPTPTPSIPMKPTMQPRKPSLSNLPSPKPSPKPTPKPSGLSPKPSGLSPKPSGLSPKPSFVSSQKSSSTVIVSKFEQPQVVYYPLSQLQDKNFVSTNGLDSTNLEQYLSDKDFETAFKMNRQAFSGQPPWKKNNAKRALKLI